MFSQAAQRDPSFRDAGAHAAATQSMSSAASTSADQLGGPAAGDQGGGAPGSMRELADAINPSTGSQGDPGSITGLPGQRPGLPESQGQDNVIPGVLNGTIIIIIPRP